jgi:hypothetical protein
MKFGYKLNVKVKKEKIYTPFWLYIIGYLLEPCIEIRRFFLNFGSNFGYCKSFNTLDFSTFYF